ncbi:MAG: hypothetical protein AAGI49_19265 [Bacteroidota bacterium]
MKETKYIEQLLEKYFEGATSLSEEQSLKAYFQQDNIAEHLKAYQPLFQYFKSAKKLQTDQEIAPWGGGVVRQLSTQSRTWWTWRIAASIAIVLSIWWYANDTWSSQNTVIATHEIDWSQHEPEDPEKALQHTLAALKLLSSKLNNGAKQAGKELDRMNDLGDLMGVERSD